MSTIIPRYGFWNPGTWSIPALYWDAFSNEQRIHAICKQLGKVIAYSDFLGTNVNDIADRLKAIEEGQLDAMIIAEIEAWFEDNQPAIIQAIDAINDALPIADFDSVNTVKSAIDNVETTATSGIDAINDVLPISEFDSVNTVKAAIDAAAESAGDVEALLPASAFTSTRTVKVRLDRVRSSYRHFVVIGDSFSVIGHNITTQSGIWWDKFGVFMKMTPHNYAVNGCGYIRGATPFSAQLTQAIADTSYDHDEVGYVIVYGSLNDCYQSFTDEAYETAVTNLITNARDEFPNAQIIIAGINTAIHQFSRTGFVTPGGLTIYHTQRGLENTLAKCANEINRCRFIPFSRIMCGVPEWFNDNHPTPTGETVIANAMACALTGAPMSFKYNRSAQSSAIFGSGTLGLSWNDSRFSWYANTATAAQTTTGSGNYAVIWPIPYGLEAMIDVSTSFTGPCSLSAKKEQPRTNLAYGYITDSIPSYVPSTTIDPSLYVQSYLVQGCDGSGTFGVHSL